LAGGKDQDTIELRTDNDPLKL